MWPRTTIEKIGSKIKNGLKFFINHGKTNSHDGRKSVGEVVGSFVKQIGDRLSNVLIGFFPNENLEELERMDINSMEADIKIDEETNSVIDVNEMTGVALGSSEQNSPAFPGAVRLASIQCFEDDDDQDDSLGNKGGQEMPTTFNDVKNFVRDNNVFPSQLFNEEDLKRDRNFAETFTSNEQLKKENEDLKTSNEKLKADSEEAIKQGRKISAEALLKKLIPKEGMTDRQTAYTLKKFNPDTLEDLSEAGLKKYISDSKEQFAEDAKLLGLNEDGSSSKHSDIDDENDDGESSPSKRDNVTDEALKEIVGA